MSVFFISQNSPGLTQQPTTVRPHKFFGPSGFYVAAEARSRHSQQAFDSSGIQSVLWASARLMILLFCAHHYVVRKSQTKEIVRRMIGWRPTPHELLGGAFPVADCVNRWLALTVKKRLDKATFGHDQQTVVMPRSYSTCRSAMAHLAR